ncbi:hypothetical protein [Paenibacillus senegalensis]|uniref:hypothetical protein n=1 Tax=Paenibacillus senegalensis TaxID=1465766 RepID=UPI00028880FF|nr:hypothetical protein [Paenibacillus senegalensis]
MTINRIAPEQVKEAYEKTGLKPMQNGWFEISTKCACGLSAVLAAEKGIEWLESQFRLRRSRSYIASERLNLLPSYVTGFTSGFDGGVFFHSEGGTSALGYEDGKAAWEAVKHLAGGGEILNERNR